MSASPPGRADGVPAPSEGHPDRRSPLVVRKVVRLWITAADRSGPQVGARAGVDALMSDNVPPRAPPGQEREGVRPMVLFRKGLYTSLGVLVTAAAAAAVYLARDVLIRALIALFLAISLDTFVRMLTRWRMPRRASAGSVTRST